MISAKNKLNEYCDEITNKIDVHTEQVLLNGHEPEPTNSARSFFISKLNEIRVKALSDPETINWYGNKYFIFIPNTKMITSIELPKTKYTEDECLFDNKVGKLVYLNDQINEKNYKELCNFINKRPRLFGPDNRNLDSFKDLITVTVLSNLIRAHGDAKEVDLTSIEDNKIEKLKVYSTEFHCLDGTEFEILTEYVPIESISEFQLIGNKISQVPNKIFQQLKNLTRIDFQSYSLETLEDDTFSGLDLLEKLNLSNSGLKEIRENAFRGLESLKSLSLSSNPLVYIDPKIFNNLKNLTELNLSYNPIEVIENDTFFALENLNKLSLRKNKIKSLSPRAFNGLNKLTFLDLNHNELESLDPKVFEQCFKLEILDLGNNLIKSIDKGTFPKSLLFLCLRNNQLTQLDCLTGLNELQFLDLFGKIEYYEDETQLMDYKSDDIEKLNLPNLKFLCLWCDKVPQFDEKFKSLQALEIYCASDFGVSPFKGLKNLEYLKIDLAQEWEKIKIYEEHFKGLSGLKFLVVNKWSSRDDKEKIEKMKKVFIDLFDQSLTLKEEVTNDGWHTAFRYKTCESEMDFVNNVLDVTDSVRNQAAILGYLTRNSYID